MNTGELCTIDYFEKKGYEVIRTSMEEVGLPDFKIFNFKTGEKFYVEEKTNKTVLSSEQEKKIISLINSGERVLLAKFDKINYILKIYELDSNLGQKHMETVEIKSKPKEIYEFICSKCQHKWKGRLKNPKQCPRCKRYDWKQEDEKLD